MEQLSEGSHAVTQKLGALYRVSMQTERNRAVQERESESNIEYVPERPVAKQRFKRPRRT